MEQDQIQPSAADEAAAEYAAGTDFDVAECAREPIHLLGGVQSHGALLALTEDDLTIAVASANTAAVLGVPAEDLVGSALSELVGQEQARRLQTVAAEADGVSVVVPLEVQVGGAPRRFEVSVHHADGLIVGEFERAAGEAFRFSSFYPSVRRALLRLQGAASVAELCQLAVQQVRAFTGYDRVVVYRFDGDGPGEVVAEDVVDGLEPWQGLWFPASDVPAQARVLYLRNWIRVIADVDDDSAALVPAVRPGTERPLDLSGSALRTVSGFHLEYLRNLGVRASMSVSLVKDDRLWGLIACHSSVPLRLSPDQRAACEMFGIALSLQLSALEDRQRAAGENQARRQLQDLVTVADEAGPAQVGDRLVMESARLLQVLPADGVYVRVGPFSSSHGLTPDPDGLAALLPLLPAVPVGRAWSTDRLGAELGDSAALAGGCAGLLMVRLSAAHDVLVWFRGEAARTVRWAADPARPVVVGSRGQRLTPRGSSAVWRQSVQGRSLPWSARELGMAQEAYRVLFEVTLRRAAALSQSNEELDAFAFAASHDLKEPVRGIATYATFIDEDAIGLDDISRERLGTIRRLAVRMDDLLNSLLEFSRMGRLELDAAPVSLDDVLDDIQEFMGPAMAEAGVELRRFTTLGTVTGDRVRLQEVFVNLISNAVKYAAASPPRWVQVGVERATPPGASSPVDAYYVRDNGIGIAPEQQEMIFQLFRRLHPPDSRGGGSGAGLTISQRIVERHGGILWVRSTPGHGATFFFTV
ncbi:ATP-binding protein [Actinoplanes derwentensis]|uniref:Sensor-like histidine kinase SenX3 n=1 Tax=Actinoplanes derwentensis TaxID=113562 RepID=A0A1H2D6X9_9ACTN|nr:ATP-binding protein [Actinoplanes derwentensis]GID90345.1 hypothetical protein Ade03nite_92690 [Actinoplanes derwentensis]SDT78354.1 Bacteriophytochrome (light-regulated signal transduction histidine kinase) [Actinoplanes derwentensis]